VTIKARRIPRAAAAAATALLFVFVLPAAAEEIQPVRSPEQLEKRYPPLREIEIPEVESFELPNGMQVFLLKDSSLPVVSGRALVRTGNLFDPEDKIGLAELTGTVLRIGGTGSRTGDEIDQELESMAASVETGVGETMGQANFWTLREHLDRVLEIYADILRNPAFRQEKLDFAKQQIRSAIARRNDEPGQIVRREFRNLVYGKDTPYGAQIEYEHLERIERADLQRFYERYFFPANVQLALYGDFDRQKAEEKIRELFAAWDARQPAAPSFPEVRGNSEGGVFRIEKTDVNQSNIRLGHLDGRLGDPDYPALRVMSTILGGGFQSRLFQQVRSNLGLAYQAGADWSAEYGHRGLFTVAVATKSETTVKAIRAVLEQVEKIREEKVSPEELQAAKDSVLNSFVFNFDTKRKTLRRLMTYRYWDYPSDFVFRFREGVEKVTRADVLRAAREHLRPEDLKIVVAGNPEDFDEPLEALGRPVTGVDISIPQPQAEVSEASEETIARGKEVLQRAQEAAGGAEALAAVRDVTREAEMRGPMGAVEQKTQVILPDILRQESQLPFGRIVVFVQGGEGWIQGPQGQRALPPAQLREARLQLLRVRERLLLSGRGPQRTVNFAGEGEAAGEPAEIVEVSGPEEFSVKLWIGSESGDLLKTAYQGTAMTGAPAAIEEVYSDFREVEGVRTPFQATVYQNGEKFADVTVKRVAYNTGLTAGDLSQR